MHSLRSALSPSVDIWTVILILMDLSPSLSLTSLRRRLARTLPPLIFVSGKACSGKSTFAKKLEKYGYRHLSFDDFVYESVIKKYHVCDNGLAFGVYRGQAPASWQKSFETEAHNLITSSLIKTKVVVDAAIGNPQILKRIFSGKLSNFLFIYLHPFDREYYYRSMFKRFREDYQSQQPSCYLWDFVTPEILADYRLYRSRSQLTWDLIKNYADESIRRSTIRLTKFRRHYPDLILTGH